MNMHQVRARKPAIVIGHDDHAKLSGLASAALDRLPEVADELLSELDRARVVEQGSVRDGVVRMGSTLEYRTADAAPRRVTLVYPGEADIAEGKVSVLTPIGAALIGLSQGQSIDWTARDGKIHRLTVVAVETPKG